MNKSGLDKVMGPYRKEICDIISEMLDNPNENGIYGTTLAYRKLDALIAQAVQEALAKQKERIKKMAGDWYYNEVYVEDLILNDLLSALDHLEEEK